MIKDIANEKVYPQASSYNTDTWEPTKLLSDRLKKYQKLLKWESWTPKSLMDIGGGKGFFAKFWPSIQETTFIEPNKKWCDCLESLELEIRIINSTFGNSFHYNPVDLILALRGGHHLWADTMSHKYITKLASHSKGKVVIETGFPDTNKTVENMISSIGNIIGGPLARVGIFLKEDDFVKCAKIFFKVKKVEDHTTSASGYETYLLERKMPPLELLSEKKKLQLIEYGGKNTKLFRDGDVWIKTGYSEIQIMQYVTIDQLFGWNTIQSILVDKSGKFIGVKQLHIEGENANNETCRKLFAKTLKEFAPIGLLPVDFKPVNIIDGKMIDIGCLWPSYPPSIADNTHFNGFYINQWAGTIVD